jgi:hypothetical protein
VTDLLSGRQVDLPKGLGCLCGVEFPTHMPEKVAVACGNHEGQLCVFVVDLEALSCVLLLQQRLLAGAITGLCIARGRMDSKGTVAPSSLWCLHATGELAVLDVEGVSEHLLRRWDCVRSGGSLADSDPVPFARWQTPPLSHGHMVKAWTTLCAAEGYAPKLFPPDLFGHPGEAVSLARWGRSPRLLAGGADGAAVVVALDPSPELAEVSVGDAFQSALDSVKGSALAAASSVMGSWSWWAPPSSSATQTDRREAALEEWRGKPAMRAHRVGSLEDTGRRLRHGQMAVEPQGRYVAMADTLGRVMVVRVADMAVCRLWKGYRSAQVAWTAAADGTLVLVIWAARRRVVEVWPPLRGERLVALRLPGSHHARLVPWSIPAEFDPAAESIDGATSGSCGCWLVWKPDESPWVSATIRI